MKISCQSCQAKYTIADDKVAGKTVKIKCKKCGATIVVHGEGGAAGAPGLDAAPAAASHEDDGEGEGDTRVFGNEGGPALGSDEWTVTITDDDQRSLTPAQILIEFQRGLITTDSYVWKDGMADWLPLSGVPELMAIVGAGPRPAAGMAAQAPAVVQAPAIVQAPAVVHAPAPVAAAAPRPAAIAAPPPNAENLGLGGTMMMDQPSPLAATPAPGVAAAKRAVNRPAVDLFATSERPRVDPNASGSGPSFSSATTSADRLVGERNENSVLFSLSALTATENAGRSNKSGNDDAVLDMRPSGGSPPRNNARAGMDDIMNLGGGMAQAPILAPPPLLAPVMEAPQPAPQPMSPVMGAPASPMMMVPEMAPQKKGSAGLILGIVAGLAVVGGLAAFFLMRTPAVPAGGATDQATTTTAVATTTAAPTAIPTAAAADPTAAVAATPSATPTAAATVKPGTPTAAVTPGKTPDKAPDKTPDKTPDPVKTAEPAKTADPAPAAGGKEFDRAAALSALNKAAGAAKGCKKDDGPTGSGKVRVTFAPSGNVTSAVVDGPPFAGTPVGGCVASAFRGAHVPPFDGSPVAVPKSFSIN
jgi:predicted Zn finger-like uncharacterized protein